MKYDKYVIIGIVVVVIVTVLILIIVYQNRTIKNNAIESDQLQYELIVSKNDIIKEANRKDSIERRKNDSLSFLLSAKSQTIIINRYYYDSSNKEVANLDDNATDSLYTRNKSAVYKKYGYLLNQSR